MTAVWTGLTFALGVYVEVVIVAVLLLAGHAGVKRLRDKQRRRCRDVERFASLDHDDEDPHPNDPNSCRCPECVANVVMIRDYLAAEELWSLPTIEEQR
jgi:hypothetical protein